MLNGNPGNKVLKMVHAQVKELSGTRPKFRQDQCNFYPYHSIPWFHAWNIGRLKIFWDSAFQELQFTMGWSHWAFKAAHLTVSWRDSTGFGLLKTKKRMLKSCQHPLFSNGTSGVCFCGVWLAAWQPLWGTRNPKPELRVSKANLRGLSS